MPRDDYRGWRSWDRPEPPPVDGPGDQLLGYGLLTAGIGSGLVWTTGQLAGLAFGHTWLHVDPVDLASVLVHLPHSWSDPALAWPAAARRALPGPVGMYGTFAATAAAAAATTGQVMRLLGNHERPEVGRLGHRTGRKSSTWAKPRELRGLFVDKPEPGRLILGRTGGLHRRLLATEDCHSVLIYGPPVISGR